MPHTLLGIPTILFQDEDILVALKPANLLVHKTNFDFGEKKNLRNWIADYTGCEVHPVHRIDKPTSGVVLFSKNRALTPFLQEQFVNHTVEKKYLALTRGYTENGGIIEKPLAGSTDSDIRPCRTDYRTISRFELAQPIGRYATSRYSIVDIVPHTGRYHQIRLHFSHLRHPIIGDTRHGDLHHNKVFREQYKVSNLLLHSYWLGIRHPNGQKMEFQAVLPEYWSDLFALWDRTEILTSARSDLRL